MMMHARMMSPQVEELQDRQARAVRQVEELQDQQARAAKHHAAQLERALAQVAVEQTPARWR